MPKYTPNTALQPQNFKSIHPLRKNANWNNEMDSGWTDYYANGTVAHTSTVGEYLKGTGAVKLQLAESNTGMRLAIGSTKDFSSSHFKIWMRASDWTEINDLNLRFMTASNLSSAYFSVQLKSYITYTGNHDDEWIEIVVPLSEFSKEQSAVDGDWASITHVLVQGKAESGKTPTVYFDDLQAITNPLSAPIVSIVFDDGHDSCATLARQVLDAYGYNATLFLAHDLVDEANYLTQNEVDDLSLSGWEIAAHGDNNLVTAYSDNASREREIRRIKRYHMKRGYRGSNLFAYPNGAWNENLTGLIKKYFEYGRSIIAINQPVGYMNEYSIHSHAVSASDSTASLTGLIDDAVTFNEWCVLLFHRIKSSGATGTEYNQADLQTVVDYCNTNSVEVLPFGDALSKISGLS